MQCVRPFLLAIVMMCIAVANVSAQEASKITAYEFIGYGNPEEAIAQLNVIIPPLASIGVAPRITGSHYFLKQGGKSHTLIVDLSKLPSHDIDIVLINTVNDSISTDAQSVMTDHVATIRQQSDIDHEWRVTVHVDLIYGQYIFAVRDRKTGILSDIRVVDTRPLR